MHLPGLVVPSQELWQLGSAILLLMHLPAEPPAPEPDRVPDNAIAETLTKALDHQTRVLEVVTELAAGRGATGAGAPPAQDTAHRGATGAGAPPARSEVPVIHVPDVAEPDFDVLSMAAKMKEMQQQMDAMKARLEAQPPAAPSGASAVPRRASSGRPFIDFKQSALPFKPSSKGN